MRKQAVFFLVVVAVAMAVWFVGFPMINEQVAINRCAEDGGSWDSATNRCYLLTKMQTPAS